MRKRTFWHVDPTKTSQPAHPYSLLRVFVFWHCGPYLEKLFLGSISYCEWIHFQGQLLWPERYTSPLTGANYFFQQWFHIWAALCKNMSSGICGQRRLRSDCASAQSDQGFRCSLTELLDSVEYINGGQMPRRDFAHAWDEAKCVHFAHAQRHIIVWRGPCYIEGANPIPLDKSPFEGEINITT